MSSSQFVRLEMPEVQNRIEADFPQNEKVVEMQTLLQNNPNFNLDNRTSKTYLVFLTAQENFEAFMNQARGIDRKLKGCNNNQKQPQQQPQQQQQPSQQQQPPAPSQQDNNAGNSNRCKPSFLPPAPPLPDNQQLLGKGGNKDSKVYSLGSLDKLPSHINLTLADPSVAGIPIPSDDDSSGSDYGANGQPVIPDKVTRKKQGKS